jgi:hypothetical protein
LLDEVELQRIEIPAMRGFLPVDDPAILPNED